MLNLHLQFFCICGAGCSVLISCMHHVTEIKMNYFLKHLSFHKFCSKKARESARKPVLDFVFHGVSLDQNLVKNSSVLDRESPSHVK